MPAKPKPCPFCGKAPSWMKERLADTGFFYALSCENPRCIGPATFMMNRKAGALKAWNTRKGES